MVTGGGPDTQLGTPAEIADYYIAPAGNDVTGDGSFASPWFSLNEAWDNVSAGDTVYCRGGTYAFDEQQDLNGASGDGVDGYISVIAYPGETPNFSKSGDLELISGDGALIYMEADSTYWSGIEISGHDDEGDDWVHNAMWVHNSDHNYFVDFNVHDNGAGFLIRGNSDSNLVLNSDFHHNYDPAGSYGDADGLQIAYNDDTTNINFVQGCRSWNNGDDGFDLWDNEGYVYFDSCWSWMNGYREDSTTTGGNGIGFKLGDSDNDTPNIFRTLTNCISFDNRSGGYSENNALCNMELFNCVAYSNGSSGTWEGGFRFTLGDNIPYYINNCIGYQNIPNNIYIDDATNATNNTWNGVVTVTEADFVSMDSTQLDNTRQGDGSLPVITFLNLVEGSDLIDAGIDVGLPYEGEAPDIGAFETVEDP